MTNEELRDLVDRATPDTPPSFDDVLDRRSRRSRRRRAAAVVGGAAAIAVIVAGTTWLRPGDDTTDPGPSVATGGPVSPSPSPTSTAPAEPPEWDGKGVPPLTLMLSDRMVVLAPWTYCYGNACVDGAPPAHLDEVGSPEVVHFSFPEPGWSFEVTFKEKSNGCGRSITVPARSIGDTAFSVTPAGSAGAWDVQLFGRGPQGGDAVYSFGWTTSTTGTMPEPDAYLGIVSTTGDETHVYAPELAINDLRSTPDEATAVITVTDAHGASRTLEPMHPEPGCSEGTLFFRGADSLVNVLQSVAEVPVTYTVRLTMDGTTYTGTAVYPDDEIKGNEPYASLTFDPPLPAYTG